MTPRPTSITVIGRILAIFGALDVGTSGVVLILIPTAMKNSSMLQQMLGQTPKLMLAQLVLGFIASAIMLACGIGLLRRKNWARYVFVGWGLVGCVYDVIVGDDSPYGLILSLLIFLVIVYFLFRPIATQFFTESGANNAC